MMRKSWLVSGIVGLVAAIVPVASMTDRTFPNLIAPICCVIAAVAVFHLVRIFVAANLSRRRGGAPVSPETAALAATVASVVFLLTPAVRAAATHFEPRLLDFTWAVLIVALAIPFLSRKEGAPSAVSPLYPILAGIAVALGLLDSALFLVLAPLYLILVVHVSRRPRTSAPHLISLPVFLFALSALLTFFAVAVPFHLDFNVFLRRMLVELTSYYRTPGWLFVFFFTTLPFLTVLFSEDGALDEQPGPVQLLFHGALSFVTVLAVVPPLSPSALMAPYGRLPVVTSAFAAAVAGYLVAYWWVNRRLKTARAVGGVLFLVLLGMSLWNLVFFDAKAATARRVVIRMDAQRAQAILQKDPDSPIANYVMGSIALRDGKNAEAEAYLRKAADAPQPLPFALNDFAEVLRCGKRYAEAERSARRCVERAPNLYVGWETLGSILMDADKDLAEAESAIRKACELSKGKDVRMLVSLARVQLKRGDASSARQTLDKIAPHADELTAAERAEFEQLQKSAR